MDEPGAVSLVVFEIAGSRYAADLTQIKRLDLFQEEGSVGNPLGAPAVGTRALVLRGDDDGDHFLAIDNLLGVESVKTSALRRLPPLAKLSPLPIGAWLDGENTVLLVDLTAMTRSEPDPKT